MTPDSALARELADELDSYRNSLHPESTYRLQLFVEIIALLRKWPEPDKDAARYKWLRMHPTWAGWEHDFQPDFVDRQIDAAMTASPQEER